MNPDLLSGLADLALLVLVLLLGYRLITLEKRIDDDPRHRR